MAQTPDTFDIRYGDGSSTQFSFNFPYLKEDEVFVDVAGEPTGFSLLTPSTVEITPAPANGAEIYIYRNTEAERVSYQFQLGAPFLPRYVDENFSQLLYAIQEGLDTFTAIDTKAQEAITVANEAAAAVANSGYEVIADYGPGITLTEYREVLRDANGEFWRLSGSTTLPYTTTGAGLPEGGAFVAVGDAVLRQELAASTAGQGSDLIAHTGTTESVTEALGKNADALNRRVIYVGSVAELEALSAPAEGQQADVLGVPFIFENAAWTPSQGYVTPAIYGDIETDAAAAIEAAVESGYVVYWGDKNYSISRVLGGGATITHPIRWKSNGAKVTLNSAAHTSSVFEYVIKPVDHKIEGIITFDANNLANIAFGVRNTDAINYPASFGTFYADGLRGINARKNSAFRAGTGIFIEGCFRSVVLKNPVARKIVMPAGQGTSGASGVAGISVSRDGISGGYSLYTEITNPDVEDVESLDLDYKDDQDGITIFGGAGASDLYSSFKIIGGRIKNSFGRSIKSQAATGSVEGTTFVRNRGFTSGIGNPEIDFQGGMGFVRDINCDYDGFVPSTIVGQRSTDINRTQGLVDGVSVKVRGAGTVLPAIVSSFSSPPIAPLVARGLSADGPIDYAIIHRTPQAISYVTIEGFDGNDVRNGLMQVVSGGILPEAADRVEIDISKAFNSGTAVRLAHQNVPGVAVSAQVTANNVVGFTGGDLLRINPTEADGPKIINRMAAMTMVPAGQEGGFVDMHSASVADGATAQFPLPSNGMAQFVARFAHTSTALFGFATSSGGRLAPLVSGANVSVGVSGIPAEATFQIWPDSTNTLINVKNNSGSARTCTIMYFVS